MPIRLKAPPVAATPRPFAGREVAPEEAESNELPGWGKAALGGGALLAGGLLARNPKGVLGGLNSLRQQLMLSGYALPKSILGGAGAVVEKSIEGRTLEPLKQLFKMQTLKDIGSAWKSGGMVGPTPGAASKIPSPGKAMGSIDEAMRNVLVRSGSSADEARSALLQAPLEGRHGEVLESGVAKVVHPFRRTPFNAWLEGWDKIKNAQQNKAALGIYGGAGALHGAATADDDFPTSIPFAIAASARYGLPYGLAAAAARGLAGGRGGGGIAGNILPVSEYGVTQAVTPSGLVKPFLKPGFVKPLEDLLGTGR